MIMYLQFTCATAWSLGVFDNDHQACMLEARGNWTWANELGHLATCLHELACDL